jgi:hypothetical protein
MPKKQSPEEILKNIPDTTCSCHCCQSMCMGVTCWPTFEEVKTLIELGYGDRLMCNWFLKRDEEILILTPANAGKEGRWASFLPLGQCTFLEEGMCQLHDKGLKPCEGRKVDHTTTHKPGNKIKANIKATWDTPEAQAYIGWWLKEYHTSVENDGVFDIVKLIGESILLRKKINDDAKN